MSKIFDIIKKYNIDHRIINHNNKVVILFAYPYKRYNDITIDAYYVTSYSGYKLAKKMIEDFDSAGVTAEIGRDLHLQQLALESGLAYMRRRNGLTYHKEYGSGFYIGAVIVNCVSMTDSFVHNPVVTIPACPSNCILCANACPNNAIGEDGVCYDKCLRHLANAPKSMTKTQIKMLNGRVLGCDICQRVCPFNKTEYVEMPIELAEICMDLKNPDNITKLADIVGKNMVRNIPDIIALNN